MEEIVFKHYGAVSPASLRQRMWEPDRTLVNRGVIKRARGERVCCGDGDHEISR